MSNISKMLFRLAGVGVIVLTGFSAAAQTERLKATPAPTPGDCKAAMSVAFGPDPSTAQIIWQHTVSTQYGANWAHWVGAKDGAVILQGAAGPQQFRAQAYPCFHYPVR